MINLKPKQRKGRKQVKVKVPRFVTSQTNRYVNYKDYIRVPEEVLPTNKMDTFRNDKYNIKKEIEIGEISELEETETREEIKPEDFMIKLDDFEFDLEESNQPEIPKQEEPKKKLIPRRVIPEPTPIVPIEKKLSLKDKLKVKPKLKKEKVNKEGEELELKLSFMEKLKALLPKPKPKVKKEKKPKVKRERKPKEKKEKKPIIPPKKKREVKPKVKPEVKKEVRKARPVRNVKPPIKKEEQLDSSSINSLLNSETYGIKDRGIINKHEQIGGEGGNE